MPIIMKYMHILKLLLNDYFIVCYYRVLMLYSVIKYVTGLLELIISFRFIQPLVSLMLLDH